jgi:uncharacterized protein (TIGR02145 family)
MKKLFLFAMIILPAMLSAQTVSNLQVSAGAAGSPGTVTFDVEWNKADLDLKTLWLDSMWVFVDYNKNGKMTRMLISGGTLTTHTATKAGTGEFIPENDMGAWVYGDARYAGSFSATVQLYTKETDIIIAGACAYASSYPPVSNWLDDTRIVFNGTPMYEIKLLHEDGFTIETVEAGSTFLLPCDYTMSSFTDKTGAPGITGIYQPQGGCTYTEPALVGTFASFDPNYSAGTYVSLTDGRDNKNYPVVKIGGRWIMARNLNYQKDLTWQANANQPAVGNSNTALIGNFWCPGGNADDSWPMISSRYSCEVWGALYSWETAMMVDGKWTSSAHSSSTWIEPTSYGTFTTSGNYQNHARSDAGAEVDGRGICPQNWHVPTDGEWGDILNAMESGTGTTHNTGTLYRGVDAGTQGKSKCMCESGACRTDENASWTYYSGAQGTDVYGFRVLPSGYRASSSSDFGYRGFYTYFWSSSAYSITDAWTRQFRYLDAIVTRLNNASRANGYSVRCIRDL